MRTLGAAPDAAGVPRDHPHAAALLVAALEQQQGARTHPGRDEVQRVGPQPGGGGSSKQQHRVQQ